jgi:DNA-directed RNA polymerase specialized sigma24 family protein
MKAERWEWQMTDRCDRDSVRRLYEEHGRGLIAYACSFVASFATAEDILHQVFERLLRGDLDEVGHRGRCRFELTIAPV